MSPSYSSNELAVPGLAFGHPETEYVWAFNKLPSWLVSLSRLLRPGEQSCQQKKVGESHFESKRL